MNRLTKPLLTSLTLLVLSACGGGDGETPLPPDSTAPIVTQTIPLDNDIDVQLGTLIKVSFNELMNSTTVNTSSFIVKDALDNTVHGVITESNTTYLFTPDSALQYDLLDLFYSPSSGCLIHEHQFFEWKTILRHWQTQIRHRLKTVHKATSSF